MNNAIQKQSTGQIATLDAESLIMKAVESNVPVESLERLLAMREKLNAERAREMYFTALSMFQAKCPIIQKTKQVKGRDGKVRYSYAPLDEVVKQVSPLLESVGLSYTIKTRSQDGHVIASCEVHHTAGHSETSEFAIPIESDAYMNSAQKSGSALTYAKRYAFCNAFGILTGDQDDDAQSLGGGVNINDIYRKVSQHMKCVLENIDSVQAIKAGIADNDLSTASEAWFELDDDTKSGLWVAPTKGGCFTTNERAVIHSKEFRVTYYGDSNE